MSALVFESNGDRLCIEISGRLLRNAQTDWDRDALDALLDVDAHPFKGSCAITTWSHELSGLRQLLLKMKSEIERQAKYDFTFREHNLDLAFEADGLGHIVMCIEIRPDPAVRRLLSFQIDADQTYCDDWIVQINAILDEFPVMLKTI